MTTCSIGLYADNNTQSCVTAANCYSNTVGDPTTLKCVYPLGKICLIQIAQVFLTFMQIRQLKYVL